MHQRLTPGRENRDRLGKLVVIRPLPRPPINPTQWISRVRGQPAAASRTILRDGGAQTIGRPGARCPRPGRGRFRPARRRPGGPHHEDSLGRSAGGCGPRPRGATDARAGLGGLCGSGAVCRPRATPSSTSPPATRRRKPTYKLVYDTVKEKRDPGLLRDRQRNGHEAGHPDLLPRRVQDLLQAVKCTEYRTVQETVCRPCVETVMKEVPYTVCKPVYEARMEKRCETVCRPVTETCYRDCTYTVCRKVQETCYKDCTYTVCRPRLRNALQDRALPDVQDGLRDALPRVCEMVCRPVTETRCRTVCKTICRPVTETVMRSVCRTSYRDCTETVMQTRIAHRLRDGLHDEDGHPRRCRRRAARPTRAGAAEAECACRSTSRLRSVHLPDGAEAVRQHDLLARGPCETRTRQVCTYRTVCEQVPCETMVKRKICTGADDGLQEGAVHRDRVRADDRDPDGEGDATRAGAVHDARGWSMKWVRKQVPYTVNRVVKGCYCDASECGGAQPGPNGIVCGCPNAASIKSHDSDGRAACSSRVACAARVVQEQRCAWSGTSHPAGARIRSRETSPNGDADACRFRRPHGADHGRKDRAGDDLPHGPGDLRQAGADQGLHDEAGESSASRSRSRRASRCRTR